MLFKILGAVALGAVIVEAFKDTSPFFLFSTSEYVHDCNHERSAANLGYTLGSTHHPQISYPQAG